MNNYTRRVGAYFIAPTTSDYIFFVSADDDTDLFLNWDIDPAHKRAVKRNDEVG